MTFIRLLFAMFVLILFLSFVAALINISARADEEAERYWRERNGDD